MAENLHDLILPNQAIGRLISDTLPSGVTVSKDARHAIMRAATIFILYATSQASSLAAKDSRKMISSDDVIKAMDSMHLEEFKDTLTEFLASYKKKQQLKKSEAAKRRQEKKASKKEIKEESDEAESP